MFQLWGAMCLYLYDIIGLCGEPAFHVECPMGVVKRLYLWTIILPFLIFKFCLHTNIFKGMKKLYTFNIYELGPQARSNSQLTSEPIKFSRDFIRLL
jgi:hypothetical protein